MPPSANPTVNDRSLLLLCSPISVSLQSESCCVQQARQTSCVNGAQFLVCQALHHHNMSMSALWFLMKSYLLSAGFPGGALVPDLINQSHHLFASHQGDSLNQLASVAVDHPMTSEGLVDASAGEHSCSCEPIHTADRCSTWCVLSIMLEGCKSDSSSYKKCIWIGHTAEAYA